jgi:glycosyltransferase involved in cell wall biosynthesis
MNKWQQLPIGTHDSETATPPVWCASDPHPQLSIVTPCYNEEACLPEFHREASDAAHAAVGGNYEIVLVNDGSRDRTLAVMRGLAVSDPHVIVVDLSRNFGHQKALSAGLQFARGDRVLAIDADLQDPPALLREMMVLMDEGSDVVYGQRRRRAGETRFKTVTAQLFYRLLRRLTEIEIPADTGDFRLMNRRTVEVFKAMPEEFRFIRGLIAWIGLSQVPVLYDRDARFAGTTAYPLRKMITFAVDAITGFSMMPLRLVSWVGLLASGASLVLVAYSLLEWLRGATLVGWTSLASIVLTIGGLQLLFLGVLGEYIGRIYMEGKHRPLFVVREVYHASVQPNATEAVEQQRVSAVAVVPKEVFRSRANALGG